MKNLVSFSTLIIALFTVTSIFGQSGKLYIEDEWNLGDDWSGSQNRTTVDTRRSADYRNQNAYEGISGLWAYEDAKSGEPFIFIIDGVKERIQLIPKNYEGDYLTLPVVRYYPKSSNGQEYYEANLGKFRIRFPKKNWYDDELGFSITNKLRIFSRVTNADFSRDQLDRITDGSVYFKNNSDFDAEIYYQTKEADLFVGIIPAGFPHFQPTQKGMRWHVKVNGWRILSVIGSEGMYPTESINNGLIPGALTTRSTSNREQTVARGVSARDELNGALNTEDLEKSIWVNRDARTGDFNLLVFNYNASQIFGRKVFQRGGRYYSSNVRSYGDSHRANFSGTGILEMEFANYGSSYFNARKNIDLLLVKGRNNTTSYFERLDQSNSDDEIMFINKLRRKAEIYYEVGTRKVLFDVLQAGDATMIPSLKSMRWVVKYEDKEQEVSLSRGDREVIINANLFNGFPRSDDDNPPIFNDSRTVANPSNKTNIMIGNPFNYTIRIYVENSERKLKPIDDLKPGEVDSFSSFMGQTWVARRSDGKIVGRHIVMKEKDIVNFSSKNK